MRSTHRKFNKVTPVAFDKAYYSTGVYQAYADTTVSENIPLCQSFIKHCHLIADSRVLDVGCGLGGLIYNFHQCGIPALGTDISPYALTHSLVPGSLIKADAFSLPFAANSFDLVISGAVIYYYPPAKQRLLIEEIKRVSKRYIYIDVVSKGTPNSSQVENPDSLRQSRYLLTKAAMHSLCRQAGLTFVDYIDPPEEDPDFHGLFQIQAGPAIDQS